MALVRATAMFRPFAGKYVYRQKVKLRPNVHYYNDNPLHIKYTCQICEQLAENLNGFLDNGNEQFARFAIPYGIEQCPCCGINIDWYFVSST